MPGVKTGATATETKANVPKVIHPLSTPGYIIIFEFVSGCVFNILVFVLTYALLAVVVPVSLVVKVAQRVILFVRLKYQGVKADSANGCETFWFLTACEAKTPSVILILTVKGRLGADAVECLLQNRLHCTNGLPSDQQANFQRLKKQPKRFFRQLVWLETAIQCGKSVSQRQTTQMTCLFNSDAKVINLKEFSSANEWQVELFGNNENLTENDVILLQFPHSMVDVHSLVYAVSKSFLDNPVFVFREEISPAQGFCLGLMALLAGPSIFVKSLLKTKDETFATSPSIDRQTAIYYSGAVCKSDVEIVTTATGTSVCDVILSCLAGSLRACLKQHGVPFPDDVMVYYPMNLEGSNSLRCFASFNIFSLPVGTEGAIPRLWEMRLRRSNVSSFVEAITSSTIMQLAFLTLPASFATRLIEFMMSKSTCTLTCILGHSLDENLLLDGRSVENFIPIDDRGQGISITIIEYKDRFQLAVLAPTAQDYVIKPSQLCAEFSRHTRVLSARLTERARVVRARGQKILNSRRNSVFIVEDDPR